MTATTKTLLALLSVLSAATTVVVEATASYRLQATSYSASTTASFELKTGNCQAGFGEDAYLLDMKKVSQDFNGNEADFNEALAAVFFKNQNAAFFVAYDGTDTPPDAPSKDYHYAIRTATDKNLKQVDEFGRAHVYQWNKQASVLCAVPVKKDPVHKEYTPKEEMKGSAGSGGGGKSGGGFFTWSRMLIAVALVGVGVVVRQRFMKPGATTAGGMLAYYNVLDGNSGGSSNSNERAYHAPGELGVNLTEGCELSYNPVVQGVV